MDSLLTQISAATAGLALEASAKVFHVPSPVGGRSALGFDGRRLLVPAIEASDGEEVAVIAPGGQPALTRVVGFDPAAGFAVLELLEPLPATAWQASPGMPALGSLLLAIAFPSDEGTEARLGLVRLAKGPPEGEDSYIQTDSAPFPGFSGAALVAPDGRLAGLVVADRGGNHGWALPALRAKKLLETIDATGFPGKSWLGVSTLPVDTPAGWKAELGDRDEAVMVVGVEEGSPASKAGLLPGDLILSLGSRTLASPEELRECIAALAPGKEVPLVLLRAGTRLEVMVTPEERADGRASAEGCGCGGHRHHGAHHGHTGHHGEGECGCSKGH